MSHIVQLDPRSPDAQTLRRAAACLQEGKTVAFPTETFYALGVSAYHEPALQKVFAIKGRMFDKPLPLIIQGESMLEEIAVQIPECARSLMRAFWPGALDSHFQGISKNSFPAHRIYRHGGGERLLPPPGPAAGHGCAAARYRYQRQCLG